MPVTTYLDKNDVGSSISDERIAEWLELVEKKTGRKPVVLEQSRWFRKDIEKKRYQVLWPTTEPEYQIINFARNDDSGLLTGLLVPAEIVIAYLIGLEKMGSSSEKGAGSR